MELNKNEVLQVFKQNFPFELVETPLGTAVKMPSKEAFLLSCVIGSGYFDNPIMPFTPKGLLKLFYNAFDYKFVTGIFEHTTLKNTPFNLTKAKPFLFDTDFKFVAPIEFNSEIELHRILDNAFETIPNPTDYLILRIEKSKKGNGMEGFMEYLTTEYFKNKGFIVENQIPLAHSLGSPDFGGYQLQETISAVSRYFKNGFHIIELAMIRQFGKANGLKANRDSQFIVGEAKTSTTSMTKQLSKYLDTALFDFGFEIHPSKKEASKPFFGIFNLDKDLKIQFSKPLTEYESISKFSKKDYEIWLNNYMKFYALANFTNDELNQFYLQLNKKRISNQNDIVKFVQNLSMSDILKKIDNL